MSDTESAPAPEPEAKRVRVEEEQTEPSVKVDETLAQAYIEKLTAAAKLRGELGLREKLGPKFNPKSVDELRAELAKAEEEAEKALGEVSAVSGEN